MSRWHQLKDRFALFLQEDNRNKKIVPDCILSDYWFPASHILFNIAMPLHMNVKAVGSLSAIHNFAWLNLQSKSLQTGSNAYYITVSNFYHPTSTALLQHFNAVNHSVRIPQLRNGVLVRYLYVYRLINYKGTLPANGLL